MEQSVPICEPFLAGFRCAHVRFRLRALSPIEMLGEKGSTLHDDLGDLFKRLSPLYFRFFFPTPGSRAAKQDPPRPFVLRPPLAISTKYPAGAELSFGLGLFGDAIDHFAVWLAVVAALGDAGIGENRGYFEIIDIESLGPDGCSRPLYDGSTERLPDRPETLQGTAIAAPWYERECPAITLELVTRLRLKDGGRLVRDPPPFHVLLQRLLERADKLATLYQRDMHLDSETKKTLVSEARSVAIDTHELRWDDWPRYSGHQHAWMQFGGFLGQIRYRGDLRPFLPWLALGEWMQVGGKTTFGLGQYTMHPHA